MRRPKAANITFLFFMTEGTSLVLTGGRHYFFKCSYEIFILQKENGFGAYDGYRGKRAFLIPESRHSQLAMNMSSTQLEGMVSRGQHKQVTDRVVTRGP